MIIRGRSSPLCAPTHLKKTSFKTENNKKTSVGGITLAYEVGFTSIGIIELREEVSITPIEVRFLKDKSLNPARRN